MTEQKTKIILIGYRATGKSTLGRALAQRLSYRFFDVDQEIESAQGQTIQRMVEQKGWPFFRKLERSCLESLIPAERMIIAPGGGAILHESVWSRLKERGLVIWLTAPVEILAARLAADTLSASQRPTLTGQDIVLEIKQVLQEREPLYRAGSHFAVDTQRPLEELVETILTLWNKSG